MEVYSLLHRGDYHPNNCEDFMLTEEIDDLFFVGAVMDGCSNGKESHFAATLMGKIIRKICKTIPHIIPDLTALSAASLGKQLLQHLFDELKIIREQLFLDRTELLSTLILLVYNYQSKELFMISVGDGVISINDQIQSIDQQNMPDYLSYHLSKDFEEWYAKQKYIFEAQAPQSVSISTDGIESFMTKTHEYAPLDVTQYLLNDLTYSQHKNMLGKKVQVMYAEHGISPKDDISIIRLIF